MPRNIFNMLELDFIEKKNKATEKLSIHYVYLNALL
jgi:hypothetical protein